MDEFISLKFPLEKERDDLQQSINRIKLMLWANDYDNARIELAQAMQRHALLIKKSLELKKHLTSVYRDNLTRIEAVYRRRGLAGRDLDQISHEGIAKVLKLRSETDDDLYLISPLTNLLRQFEKHINEQVGRDTDTHRRHQGLEQDNLSSLGYDSLDDFRISVTPYGPLQWAARGYRLKPPSVNVSALAANLKKIFPVEMVNVENRPLERGWPLWYRVFLLDAYIEVKVFDSGRFELSIVSGGEIEIDSYLSAVMHAFEASKDDAQSAHRH